MKIILNFLLTLLFYLAFTPIAVILRLLNVDVIKKNIDYKAETYWENYNVSPGNFLHSIKRTDSR